jgi:lipopolysaccharide transport system ATP-binding protein
VGSLLEVGTGFHPELTGRENIYLNGAILGMRKAEIERRFDEIVAFAELEKFIDTPVKHYSSGMYVRLAFAVAAHLEPEILLVDEVLAVGDVEFQRKCLGRMQDVAGEGRTVLFVSHDMGAVERLCSRVVLLENGKVVEDGPGRQVIARYLQSGMRQLGERVWTDPTRAPGNEVVRLRAVRARNAQGRVADEFKVTEPFCVEVEFWVLSPDYQLNVSFYFYNESRTLIFMTGDFQDSTWHNRTRPPGIHRSTCHVPGNLLNEGTISVLAGVVTNPHTLHALERDAITFQIVDDWQPKGARGYYPQKWRGGVIRPLLGWAFDFEPLENEEIGPRDIKPKEGTR